MASQMPVCQKKTGKSGPKTFFRFICVLLDYIAEQHAVKFICVNGWVFDIIRMHPCAASGHPNSIKIDTGMIHKRKKGIDSGHAPGIFFSAKQH
jgi:hypothetical protein